jgi:hypothetical protein
MREIHDQPDRDVGWADRNSVDGGSDAPGGPDRLPEAGRRAVMRDAPERAALSLEYEQKVKAYKISAVTSRDGSAVVVDQLCGWVPRGESDADWSCLVGRGADLDDVVAGAGAAGGCRVPNPEQVEPSDVFAQPTPRDQ